MTRTFGFGVESHCISSSIVRRFIFEAFSTRAAWRNVSVKHLVDGCESKDPKGKRQNWDTRSLRGEIWLFVGLLLRDNRFWDDFDFDGCGCGCPVFITWGLPEWENISSQTFSESDTLSVRMNRHWFRSRFESVSPSSSFSPRPGPTLTSATFECSHINLLPALRGNCCLPRAENSKRNFDFRDKLVWENVVIPQEVVLSHPTTTRRSPFWASRPRGPLTNLYQSSAWVAIYCPSLEGILRSSEYAPSGIVRIAPSDADDSKIKPLRKMTNKFRKLELTRRTSFHWDLAWILWLTN